MPSLYEMIAARVDEWRTQGYPHGEYELGAPKGETTVAVKITDMLGEEVLIAKKV